MIESEKDEYLGISRTNINNKIKSKKIKNNNNNKKKSLKDNQQILDEKDKCSFSNKNSNANEIVHIHSDKLNSDNDKIQNNNDNALFKRESFTENNSDGNNSSTLNLSRLNSNCESEDISAQKESSNLLNDFNVKINNNTNSNKKKDKNKEVFLYNTSKLNAKKETKHSNINKIVSGKGKKTPFFSSNSNNTINKNEYTTYEEDDYYYDYNDYDYSYKNKSFKGHIDEKDGEIRNNRARNKYDNNDSNVSSNNSNINSKKTNVTMNVNYNNNFILFNNNPSNSSNNLIGQMMNNNVFFKNMMSIVNAYNINGTINPSNFQNKSSFFIDKELVTNITNDISKFNNNNELLLKSIKPIQMLLIDFIKKDLFSKIEHTFTSILYGSFATGLSIEKSDIDMKLEILINDNQPIEFKTYLNQTENNNEDNSDSIKMKQAENTLNICIDKIVDHANSYTFIKGLNHISTAKIPVIKMVIFIYLDF